MAQDWEMVLTGARIATMCPQTDRDRYGGTVIEDGAIAIAGGRIVWVGARADLPSDRLARCPDRRRLEGRWVTPGLIDCHTHLVHAGNRAWEFERRLAGTSYAEIARSGGGIRSTVAATRAADEARLLTESWPRLAAILGEGVTTVEIKSGYGLDTASERRMLRVARRIGTAVAVTVRTSFLGAHAVPPEFDGAADAYVDALCRTMLPALAAEGLVDAVDAFCETIAFSPEQVARVFEAARALGLPVKLHADQLSDLGGGALAARHGALSADHLEYLSADGVAAMRVAGTVAVLLPGAFYMLGETRRPPVAALRGARVPMAVATDANPGTSPVLSPLAAANMACLLFGLTVGEALAGLTREAARALGLLGDRGTIEPGKRADLAIWPVEDPAQLVHTLGADYRPETLVAGKPRPEPHPGHLPASLQ